MKKKMGRPRLSKKGVAVLFAVRLPPEEAQDVDGGCPCFRPNEDQTG